MDIDEVVESAGIHTHDNLTGDPGRSSGVGGGGGGSDSWTCRLLRLGWGLTRKAAIAGAAATAAPVVAPPLIVLSAAGVALSVPFAAYLASLAATNHLMGALLRSCYPPTTMPYYHQEDHDLEQEFLDASEEYGQGAPDFTQTEQGEENEADTLLLLLPRDHGVSEALAPVFADEKVEEEEEEVEISAQESGQESYASNRGDETEEHTPVEGKEALPRGFGVSASAKPLFSDEDTLVQEKGEGEFTAHDLGQHSLLSSMGDKKEQGMTMEKKSTDDMPQRDSVVSESTAPVFHGEDNMVQSKEGFEGTVQGVVEETNSNTDIVMGEVAEVHVEIIAIAAPEIEALPQGNLVAHESPADPVTGEIVDVQVDIVAAAAPESEVLPLSGLVALESQAVAETAHVAEVKNQKGMSMEEKKSTDDMPPRDLIVSESPAPVFHGEDNVVQRGFQGTLEGVVEEANSNTDLVMAEVADVQLQIISIAAPETESEVLPPIDLVAHELPAAELVAGEVVDVQVDIVAAAAPGNEVLRPSDHATSESTADPVIEEIVDVQVDIVAAAAPGNEMLPLSSPAACKSQAVAETAHVGEIIGITVMEDIVRDFDGVNKEGVSFVPVASVHDGEDVMSSGSTTYLSTVEEEAFGSRVVAGGEAHYTEEQLREQLNTIRTITGYGAVLSPTLEGELAGLYIFVGVEPTVALGDTSDRLMELNAKLRFLKSIIGVD